MPCYSSLFYICSNNIARFNYFIQLDSSCSVTSSSSFACLLDARITSKVEKGQVVLLISDATRADSGNYEVVVKNSEGEASAALKLNVTGKFANF